MPRYEKTDEMPRSFLVKTKQLQQQQRHDVTEMTDDVRTDGAVKTDVCLRPSNFAYDVQSHLNSAAGDGVSSSSNIRPVNESRFNTTEPSKCNVTPSAGVSLSHLANMVTSSPLFNVYNDPLVWLRQLHAMCACAETPFPLSLPAAAVALPPTHHLLTSPEPAYYVTKMAGVPPMQPFDPRWASCPSPSTAPAVVDAATTRAVDSKHGGRSSHVGGHVGGRSHDFSIPSILSRSGSTTGSDSDATTETEDRCQSTSSSLPDDVGSAVMTSASYDSVPRAPVNPMSHQRRRQHDKQQFECPQCNKVYGTVGALKMHVRTHTLPCRCPLCGKAFSRPWLLQGHVRTHTGERPFQCPHCDRAFADRSNLRAHLQTHGGVKRYRCQTCDKPFSRMSLLVKHNDASSCRSN